MSSQRSRTKVAEFKAVTQAKIDGILNEYASGRISREQFDAIYAHYSSQLDLAEAALEESNTGLIEDAAGRTIGIRKSWMGKARGVLIYHRRSKTFLEALGAFDVNQDAFAEHFRRTAASAPDRTGVLFRKEAIEGGRWLLYTSGKHTLVVTLFGHEPAPTQIAEMQRLHTDFETANQHLIAAPAIQADRLAFPFHVIIQRKLGRS
ncbi:MAG: hypothetical protein IPK19_17660 [Chloroflexi bacterium]|nr:hypothetical protein [Chloroflexota bacterium]